ncbi:MAG: hypothetical protein M0R74_15765 [Dehalococcoidia bacterium]|nr:hypothetical protein [Dehalococcoidia bacterium]
MKIYFAAQIAPDTTQIPTLRRCPGLGGLNILLAYYHKAGGYLNGAEVREVIL